MKVIILWMSVGVVGGVVTGERNGNGSGVAGLQYRPGRQQHSQVPLSLYSHICGITSLR